MVTLFQSNLHHWVVWDGTRDEGRTKWEATSGSHWGTEVVCNYPNKMQKAGVRSWRAGPPRLLKSVKDFVNWLSILLIGWILQVPSGNGGTFLWCKELQGAMWHPNSCGSGLKKAAVLPLSLLLYFDGSLTFNYKFGPEGPYWNDWLLLHTLVHNIIPRNTAIHFAPLLS